LARPVTITVGSPIVCGISDHCLVREIELFTSYIKLYICCLQIHTFFKVY
jgi:hypothetical protein